MATSETMKRLVELASRQDLEAFDEAWVEQVGNDPSDVEGFIEAVRRLESQGQFTKAGQRLAQLVPVYIEGGQDDAALRVLRKMADVAPREKGIRHNFIQVLGRKYAHRDDLEALVEHAGLTGGADLLQAVERLESYLMFSPGAYVEHPAGWGVGVVTEADSAEAEVTIDFAEQKGHRISLEMAHNITNHLEADSFKAMKFDRLDQVMAMTTDDPVSLIKKVVAGRNRKTTVRDVRETLTDGVVPQKEWTKWWGRARTKLKRDPNIKLGAGNNPTVEVTATEQTFEEQTLMSLRGLKGLGAKVKFVRALFAELESHAKESEPAQLEETRRAILTSTSMLAKNVDESGDAPGAVLSLALMLENVGDLDSDYKIPDELRLEHLLSDPAEVLDMLKSVPVTADRRQILERLRTRFPDQWQDVYEQALYLGENDVGDFCLKELTGASAFDRMTRVIFELLDRFRENRKAFLWYTKAALAGKLHDALPFPGLPSLLEKTFILHSHVQSRYLQTETPALRTEFKNIEKVFQARGYNIVKKTIAECDLSRARDLYNMVRSSRSLPDDVKDGVIAAILRTNAEVARDNKSEEAVEDTEFIDDRVLWVTREGFERFEDEFNKLVNDDIPKNAQEIGRAASYGDLSENAEWTAALDRQSMLSRKAEEMREQIEKARIIDESVISNEEVNVGCKVSVKNVGSDTTETYTLLGPWDVDTDRGIISYLSPLGRHLLGHKVGETTEFVLPEVKVTYEVLEISNGLAEVSSS